MSRHANITSKASHRQPVGHPINQDNLANEEIDDGSSDDADDEEDEDENQINGLKRRRSRTMNNNIRPSQLRFYTGNWVDVLVSAKNNYRLFIHNEDPFPERSAASLEDARACLLDAVGKFKEENHLPLDNGMLFQS